MCDCSALGSAHGALRGGGVGKYAEPCAQAPSDKDAVASPDDAAGIASAFDDAKAGILIRERGDQFAYPQIGKREGLALGRNLGYREDS
jgi:hypothetical protein